MLTHSFEMRDATVTGRTLTILAAPFDQPAPILDEGGEPILEQFARGAFRNAVKAPNRVELRYEHRQDGPPYALGVQMREDTAGLVGTWRVAPSTDGDRLLGLVSDEQLRGASVGFIPGDHPDDNTWTGNTIVRHYIKHLAEVSLTAAPVYEAAQVMELRSRKSAVDVKTRERERWKWRGLALS